MPLWLKVVTALLAVVVLYGSVTFVQVWQASREDQARRADAIVVLGAAQYNGRPSPALLDRLEHALDLYKRRLAPLVVVTGGRRQGDRFTEATTGYNWLRRRGVPDRAIVKEVNGRSTWESLSAVAHILKPRGATNIVLVSNPAHAERIAQVSAEVGLHPRVSPVPGSAGLASLLHETGAVAVGRLIGYRRLEQLGR
ncbi:MAG: YdcF family protein [Actinomycetota bacterium]|nr:YdcF family protein [Actinomycetota bacterium]